MSTLQRTTSRYVTETSDRYLALFPHRHDYIWAEHPQPGQTPQWQTETRHPLSDRLIQQGAYLYGVRFGSTTNYCVLDIDRGSLYHPKRDPYALDRLVAALEPIGLVSYVACTSSYSGGIHLYFPFEQAQKTWELALVLQALLENAGFKPALGQLELFPNVRLYVTDGPPNLYGAHRLPMQAGSYVLNEDWDLVNSDREVFVQRWLFAQSRNDVDTKTIRQVLKASRRRRYSLSGKADKFLNDLNADIEPGWSDYGQTNYLLGRIALRSYVFGHLLYNCHPLEGTALVADIVRVARSLPGYTDWCRHQQEIERRAQEWATCVENSHYFHFGQKQKRSMSDGAEIAGSATSDESTNVSSATTLSWNQQRSLATREKIRSAIADLLNQNTLPATATARFQVLTGYGIGGGALYRHRDLWHPAHLTETPATLPVENSETNLQAECWLACAESAPNQQLPTSLLANSDGNFALGTGWGAIVGASEQEEDSNALLDEESGETQGIEGVRQVVMGIRDRRERQQRQVLPSVVEEPDGRGNALLVRRMLGYLQSGDPILVAEARSWLRGLRAEGSELETPPQL